MIISESVSDLTSILEKLGSILPKERILFEAEDIIPYSFVGTGALSHRSVAMDLARTTEEISRVLRWANESRTPLVWWCGEAVRACPVAAYRARGVWSWRSGRS